MSLKRKTSVFHGPFSSVQSVGTTQVSSCLQFPEVHQLDSLATGSPGAREPDCSLADVGSDGTEKTSVFFLPQGGRELGSLEPMVVPLSHRGLRVSNRWVPLSHRGLQWVPAFASRPSSRITGSQPDRFRYITIFSPLPYSYGHTHQKAPDPV